MLIFFRWKRWIGGFVILLVIGTLVTILIGRMILKRSLPQIEGELRLEGLHTSAEIIRDSNGVVHILARNNHDALFLQGYAHAQDRLWQMDLLRRAACGELSEIFGSVTLSADQTMRTIGLLQVAQKISDSMDFHTRQKIQWYSDGINAFLYTHVDNLPDEFVLLSYKPRHWEIIHSIAISRLIAWMLNMAWYVDGVYAKIIDSVGFAKAREIFPETDERSPVIVPDWKPGPSFRRFLRDSLAFFPREKIKDSLPADTLTIPPFLNQIPAWPTPFFSMLRNSFSGSNNWVIHGSRTRSGKPLIANDPHLPVMLPSLWYENHLSGGDYDVTGFSIPGMPFVVIGNNEAIAWAFTNAMADEADLYMETIREEKYLFNDQWRPLRRRTEIIWVKDSAAVELTVYSTHRGPLVSGIQHYPAVEEKALSFRWMGMDVSQEFTAFDRLNRAKNWEDFRRAAADYHLPAQNAVYADTAGHIGYQFFGRIPVRRDARYYTVLDGSSGIYDWRGLADFADLPYRFNPPEGFIATANNPIVPGKSGVYFSAYWEPDSRIRRLYELLQSSVPVSVNECRLIQTDIVSPFAGDILPLLLKACERDSQIFPIPMEPDSLNYYQEAYLLLKQWDGSMSGESQPALIFNFFLREWLQQTFRDDMGDSLYRAFTYLHLLPHRAILRILNYKTSAWWDDRSTSGMIENRDDIIRRAFKAAIDTAYARYGFSPSGWFWKEAHHIKFAHPLGSVYPLNYHFNAGEYPMEGSGTTVLKSEYRFDSGDFNTTVSATFRRILDLADSRTSYSILPTGQSGQPMSSWYFNQYELWAKGELKIVQTHLSALQNLPYRLRIVPR